MTKNELLTICMGCQRVRINDESNLWLSKEENPNLYEGLLEEHEGNLSHGYCPPCGERAMEEADNFFQESTQLSQ